MHVCGFAIVCISFVLSVLESKHADMHVSVQWAQAYIVNVFRHHYCLTDTERRALVLSAGGNNTDYDSRVLVEQQS